jgi:DNA-directed RNA polymerase specialized sigma24 family protein
VEGCEIEDVAVFTRGVARLVLREARLAESRERSVVELPAPESNTKETDAACLENCISALPKATRDLIERYYLSASGSKAAARKELAASLDIEMDALRSRALRARRQLEICMQDCRERHRNDVMNAQNSSFRNKVS